MFLHPLGGLFTPKNVETFYDGDFLKLLDLAENLNSEKFDGAEFIFDVILTQKKFWPSLGAILTPQNVDLPYDNDFLNVVRLSWKMPFE